MANQSAQAKWTGAMGVVAEKYPSANRRERSLSIIGNAATAPTAIGMAIPTATGTIAARNWASTNLLTQTVRVGYDSAGTGGAAAGIRGGVANIYRGDGPGKGGFAVIMQFANSDAAPVAATTSFVGLAATTSAIGVTTEPTAITNCVGVGVVSTLANWQLTWNDASGTGTKIDLGSGFLVTDVNSLFTLEIFCDVNDPNRAIHVSVTNESTGEHQRFVIPGDHATVPVATTAMTYHFHRSNNATAAAVGIDVSKFVCYTRI